MGYMLSSLAHLPIDDAIDLYIFVINGGWQGGNHDIIERNFSRIAKEIGSKAVIAKGFDDQQWSGKICTKYLGKNYEDIFRLLPALLITDSHPEKLTEDSTRLLIPLDNINEKFGNSDRFFSALTKFARDKNPAFLELFERKESLVKTTTGMLELKPNFCGVGINLNAVIDRIYSKGN